MHLINLDDVFVLNDIWFDVVEGMNGITLKFGDKASMPRFLTSSGIKIRVQYR